MKWFLAILLLANAATAGLIWLNAQPAAPERSSREQHPERMRIVQNSASAPEEAASSPIEASAPTEVVASAVVTTEAGKLCLRWEGVTGENIDPARALLTQAGVSFRERSSPASNKVWVYIPPLDTLEQAQEKARQLKDLGVDDYFVVNDGGRWQNAISLGVLSTPEAGERMLEELRNKGVKSAVARERDDTLRNATFTIRNASDAQFQQFKRANAQYRGARINRLATCD